MTVITLVKTLPASLLYTGSGVTTITLSNFDNMIINSKKSLTKFKKLKTKNSQNTGNTDLLDNYVVDLKNVDQTIKFTGWLDDDASETAWNKFWKLVAMQTRGGPLTSLTIGTSDKLIFPTSDGINPSGSPVYPTTTQQAFVESVTGNIVSDDTGDITASHSAKPARIKVDLDIYLGYER
jgi:hypothetical protein